jgi:co-chaperonin GroES (HSP10)
MNIKPLGFYVLIEMESFEETTAGGIVLPGDLVNKEQDATSIGYVRGIGPTAYDGYPGCNSVSPSHDWGLEIGQKVEYRKFEGKKSAAPGCENYRYIPDSHIIGAIE